MKKLLLSITILFAFNICYGQIATGVNNLQAFPWRTFANDNMVGLVYDGSQYRMYGFNKYSLLDTTNATGRFATKYDVSLKTNRSQTITINGTTYDLSGNRTWTVGDVTTAALTSGLSTKQNSVNLTTTGTGAATFNQSTGALNIPTPTTYTAGIGIGIASSVISNTAPYIAPVISTPTMVLGASYQAPANKNIWINASITHTIALTLVLSSGSSSVQLQTSPNNSTWTTINSCGFSDAVAVAVALNKTVTNNVSGEVPPNYYYRLVATTSGAGSAAIVNQQLKTY